MKVSLIITFIIAFSSTLFARPAIEGNRFEALTGTRTEKVSVLIKSKAEGALLYRDGKTPSPFLSKHYMFLPPNSRILDSNLGDGHNAVFLAMKGYSVVGISKSEESIKRAHKLARDYGVRIETHLGDVKDLKGKQFDAILSIDDVNRRMYKKLFELLRPRGYMVIEGPVSAKVSKRDRKKYLSSQELLSLFSSVRIVYFLEMLRTDRPLARLIIKKQ